MKAAIAAILALCFATFIGCCLEFNRGRSDFEGSEFERGARFSIEYYKLNHSYPSLELRQMVFANDTLDASFFDLSQEQGILNAAMVNQ